MKVIFCDWTKPHLNKWTAESAHELAESPEIKVELVKLHECGLAIFPSLCTDTDLLGNHYCPSKQKDVSKGTSDSLSLLGKESCTQQAPIAHRLREHSAADHPPSWATTCHRGRWAGGGSHHVVTLPARQYGFTWDYPVRTLREKWAEAGEHTSQPTSFQHPLLKDSMPAAAAPTPQRPPRLACCSPPPPTTRSHN